MLLEVGKNIDQRVPDGSWRSESARVIPIGKHLAAARERVVHRAGKTHGQAAQSARQRPPVIGLRDEVNVIPLDRELYDPEVRVRGRGERAADGWKDAIRSQALEGRHGSQGHVNGMRRNVFGASAVGHARATVRVTLAPGSGPATTQGAWGWE